MQHIAERIHAQLHPHREALQRAAGKEEQASENAKFTFEFADVGRAEQGALSERLGLPGPDVDKAMRDEHDSEAEWTTGNYHMTTHPKQEFEFVDCPQEDKTYPGEGAGGRRRQKAEEVWREVHAKVPAGEVLQGFKSRLGKVDVAVMRRIVQEQLRQHANEEEKKERSVAEWRQALMQALTPTGAVPVGDVEGFVQRLDGEVVRAAAGRGWMSDVEKYEWVERELAREVRELQERLADLTLVEVKAIIL